MIFSAVACKISFLEVVCTEFWKKRRTGTVSISLS